MTPTAMPIAMAIPRDLRMAALLPKSCKDFAPNRSEGASKLVEGGSSGGRRRIVLASAAVSAKRALPAHLRYLDKDRTDFDRGQLRAELRGVLIPWRAACSRPSLLYLRRRSPPHPFLAPDQRITHQPRHRAHHRFDIGFTLLQQVEKLLSAWSRVRSHDRVHVIPADCSSHLMASANGIDARSHQFSWRSWAPNENVHAWQSAAGPLSREAAGGAVTATQGRQASPKRGIRS